MLLTLPWLFEIVNFISPVRLDGNTSQFGPAVEQSSRVVLYFVEVPLKNAFGLLVLTLCPTSLMCCSRKHPYPLRSFQVDPPPPFQPPLEILPFELLSLQ